MASETFNPDLPERLDPEELGFMCGIEVHQQLATGKLHSRQEGILFDVTTDSIPKDWPSVQRRLRAASGEGGQMDVAAKFESRRKVTHKDSLKTWKQLLSSNWVEFDFKKSKSA